MAKDQGMTTDTRRRRCFDHASVELGKPADLPVGELDGAWVPEPWATQMIQAGGHVLVDERTLWPEGKYVTTHLIVSTAFLQAHPDVVKNLIKGELAATDYVQQQRCCSPIHCCQ
jgi:ABC-type nitrate/sulfonate/bicarbonate transport system substrate-binding protein